MAPATFPSRFSLSRTSLKAGARTAPRASPHAVLEVLIRGAVVETAAAMPCALHRGSALLVPAGIPRSRACTSSGELLTVSLPAMPGLSSGVVFDSTARAWSLNLIREIETRDPRWELVAEGLILQGIGWLMRLSEQAADRPSWLDAAVELARQQQPLGRIATLIGRHASHVARDFRRHEGVSVGEFSRRCRLELAATMLASGETSLSGVALASGFCDQSHFTRAFRQVFGVTPAAYRQASRREGTRKPGRTPRSS